MMAVPFQARLSHADFEPDETSNSSVELDAVSQLEIVCRYQVDQGWQCPPEGDADPEPHCRHDCKDGCGPGRHHGVRGPTDVNIWMLLLCTMYLRLNDFLFLLAKVAHKRGWRLYGHMQSW